MFQSPEMLSVMSLSRNFLPATENIPWKLAEGISINGGIFLPVDCHVLGIEGTGQVHALRVADGRSCRARRSIAHPATSGRLSGVCRSNLGPPSTGASVPRQKIPLGDAKFRDGLASSRLRHSRLSPGKGRSGLSPHTAAFGLHPMCWALFFRRAAAELGARF